MTQIYTDVNRKHDFILFFDVTNGNPNGDPDAGNLPRTDPETMHGLVTDVAIKRKVRDFVDMTKAEEARYNIFIRKDDQALNAKLEEAYGAEDMKKGGSKAKETKKDKEEIGRKYMCHNFFDVRTFGAVMSTGDYKCGKVTGPLQIDFASSIDPILPLNVTITRVAVTRVTDDKETEMGRKTIVPYGLYQARGYFNPFLARRTGFQDDDLDIFWQALEYMWEFDRSAARGTMVCRGIYIFSHSNALGNAKSHKLFERITCNRKNETQIARSFGDYTISVNEENMPEGVTLTRLGE